MRVHPALEFSPLWSSMRCHWESSVYGLSCSVVLFILSFGEVRDHCSQFRERLGPVYSDGPSCTPSYSIVLQCTPLYSSVLRCTQVYSGVLRCTLVYSSVLRCTPAYSSVPLCIPAYPSVLQCTLSHGDPFTMSGRAYIPSGIRASLSRVGCQKCSAGSNLFPHAIPLLA